MATGIMAWLTPLAAVGLVIVALLAAGFHLRMNEHLNALETVLLAAIAGSIAVGRWEFLAAADVAPWVLVSAVWVLVPAAVINIVVLVRRQAPEVPEPAR